MNNSSKKQNKIPVKIRKDFHKEIFVKVRIFFLKEINFFFFKQTKKQKTNIYVYIFI